MTDFLWFVLILAILFLPWGRIWDKLLDKEEEEMTPESNVSDDELFQAKVKCLELACANSVGTARTAETILADAQKFWDFLLKADPESNTE